MKRYPDKFFDLAVVDPPYGKDIANRKNYGKNGGTDERWKNKREEYYSLKKWDKNIPTQEYFTELIRVSKNQIVWGGNYFGLKGGANVWDKYASGNYSDGEIAINTLEDGVKFFRYLWNGFRKEKPENRIHPTQKPVGLYSWIYGKYTSEGQNILDTHLGSGSNRIAAYKANLSFIGCELDEEYFEKQEARFKKFVCDGKI